MLLERPVELAGREELGAFLDVRERRRGRERGQQQLRLRLRFGERGHEALAPRALELPALRRR